MLTHLGFVAVVLMLVMPVMLVVLMVMMPVMLVVLVIVMMRCGIVRAAMMMLVMVVTPVGMVVLMTMVWVVGGMLVGVPMMTVFVRMVMLVFVSSAHGRSSSMVSERSPLRGLGLNLGKDEQGTCQSARVKWEPLLPCATARRST